MNKKLLILLIIVLMFCVVFTAYGSQKEVTISTKTFTLSVGTYSAYNSSDGMTMEYFKKNVEEATNGAIEVNVYHNNALGNTNTQIENVIMGTQDIFLVGTGPLSQWVPEIKYLSIPYLWRDDEHLIAFLNSDILDPSIKSFADKNVMFLDDQWRFVQGPFRVIVSTVPINSFEDLKGLKMRVPEVETQQKSWSAFGCNPITIAYSEVYLALETGMAQALTCPFSSVRAESFCEVAKYIIRTDTWPQRYALIMSKSKFDSMPEEYQQILREVAYDCGDYFSQLILDDFDSDLDYLVNELGAIYKDDLDLEPFRKTMEQLYIEWEKSGYLKPGITEKIKSL